MILTYNFLILPNQKKSTLKILIDSGRSLFEANNIIQNIGFNNLAYANERPFSEIVFSGLKIIKDNFSECVSGIDSIIVVSQTYDNKIPSMSTLSQNFLSLNSNTYCIDIIDGCSGYIKALSIVELLRFKGYKKTIIIAGDINSSMTIKSEVGTKVLFGDGISISIFEEFGIPIQTKILNNGDSENVIHCSHSINKLEMNGFEVFRFTRNNVPSLIQNFLSENNMSIEDFDLIALHQASKLVVSSLFSELKCSNSLGKDFSCEEIGNIGSGSIGAWISNIDDIERFGELNLLAVGFGSGLSWGLASLVTKLKKNEVLYV